MDSIINRFVEVYYQRDVRQLLDATRTAALSPAQLRRLKEVFEDLEQLKDDQKLIGLDLTEQQAFDQLTMRIQRALNTDAPLNRDELNRQFSIAVAQGNIDEPRRLSQQGADVNSAAFISKAATALSSNNIAKVIIVDGSSPRAPKTAIDGRALFGENMKAIGISITPIYKALEVAEASPAVGEKSVRACNPILEVFSNKDLLQRIFSFLTVAQGRRAAPACRRFHFAAVTITFAHCLPKDLSPFLPTPKTIGELPVHLLKATRYDSTHFIRYDIMKDGEVFIKGVADEFGTTHITQIDQLEQPLMRVVDPWGRPALAIRYTWRVLTGLEVKSGKSVVVIHIKHIRTNGTWVAGQANDKWTKLDGTQSEAVSSGISSLLLKPDYLKRLMAGEACGLPRCNTATGKVTEGPRTFHFNGAELAYISLL